LIPADVQYLDNGDPQGLFIAKKLRTLEEVQAGPISPKIEKGGFEYQQLAMLRQRLVKAIEFGLESYQSEDDQDAQRNNNNNNDESENSISKDRKVLQISSNCQRTKLTYHIDSTDLPTVAGVLTVRPSALRLRSPHFGGSGSHHRQYFGDDSAPRCFNPRNLRILEKAQSRLFHHREGQYDMTAL
jgi:hypothetical protein